MKITADALTERHFKLLRKLQIGGCTCLTKTPELRFHAENCQYRLAAEIEHALLAASPTDQAAAAPSALNEQIQQAKDELTAMPSEKRASLLLDGTDLYLQRAAVTINQCDGCAINAPLTARGNHAMPDGGFMGCTKEQHHE
jgi:hypothetical protein